MARHGLVPCMSIGEAVFLETAHEGHRESWVQVLERDRYLLTGGASEITILVGRSGVCSTWAEPVTNWSTWPLCVLLKSSVKISQNQSSCTLSSSRRYPDGDPKR